MFIDPSRDNIDPRTKLTKWSHDVGIPPSPPPNFVPLSIIYISLKAFLSDGEALIYF